MTWVDVENVLSMTCQSDLIWTRINFKYSLHILAYVNEGQLLGETLSVCILVFIPQNFILKNNLQRQHLLMIPLLWWICEKLAHETLDNSPIKKVSDDYYKWLLESYIWELNSTILYECIKCAFRWWRKSYLKSHLKY